MGRGGFASAQLASSIRYVLDQRSCAGWSHVLMQPSGLSGSERHRVPSADLCVRRETERWAGRTRHVERKEMSNCQLLSDRNASEQNLRAPLFGLVYLLMLPRWKAMPPVQSATGAYDINRTMCAHPLVMSGRTALVCLFANTVRTALLKDLF